MNRRGLGRFGGKIGKLGEGIERNLNGEGFKIDSVDIITDMCPFS